MPQPSQRPSMWRNLSFDPRGAFYRLGQSKGMDHDAADQEVELLEEHNSKHPEKSRRVRIADSSRRWRLTSAILACVALVQFTIIILQATGNSLHGSYGSFGHATDFPGTPPMITHLQHRFGHALYVSPNGTVTESRNHHGEPPYTGTPSESLDTAWTSLLARRYFRFTDAEVAAFNADKDLPFVEAIPRIPGTVAEAGVYGGLDFMHSLHCLNALRKHIDAKPEDWDSVTLSGGLHIGRLHIDHCVDQLRQAILCHGDTTPVTLKPVKLENGLWVLIGETERTHTCRDPLPLLEWVRQRGERDGYVEVAE